MLQVCTCDLCSVAGKRKTIQQDRTREIGEKDKIKEFKMKEIMEKMMLEMQRLCEVEEILENE